MPIDTQPLLVDLLHETRPNETVNKPNKLAPYDGLPGDREAIKHHPVRCQGIIITSYRVLSSQVSPTDLALPPNGIQLGACR